MTKSGFPFQTLEEPFSHLRLAALETGKWRAKSLVEIEHRLQPIEDLERRTAKVDVKCRRTASMKLPDNVSLFLS